MIFNRNWKIWLGVWLAILLVGGGLSVLLAFQDLKFASNVLAIIADTVGSLWTLWGLYTWRQTPWVRRLNSFVLTGLGFGFLYLLLTAVGADALAQTTLYIGTAIVGFLLGINVLRLILQPGWPILGVARTMLEEALRMKVALIFILALLVLLPMMPLILGTDDRVTYRVQRFLIYGMMIISFSLSVLTVVVGAYTTSRDLKSHQIFMSLTKPLSRWQYILGKWLGLVLLNLVLLGVSGVAMYGFAQLIAKGPALNDSDRRKVNSEILTARVSVDPVPLEGSVDEMFNNYLAARQKDDPQRFGTEGSPASALPEDVRSQIYQEALTYWFTITPNNVQTYRFTGLEKVAQNARQAQQLAIEKLTLAGVDVKLAEQFVEYRAGRAARPDLSFLATLTKPQADELQAILSRDTVQLVFHPSAVPEPPDQMLELGLTVNDMPWPIDYQTEQPIATRGAVDTDLEIILPAWLINDDGALEIEFFVPAERFSDGRPQTAVQLNRKDNIPEVYYRDGSFSGNLFRALLVIWLRLCFLAMFGLVLGALLSFPVACLAGLMIYVIAAASGYIDESVSEYATSPENASTWDLISGTFQTTFHKLGEGEIYEAFKILIGLSARFFLLFIPSFGEYDPAEYLANGVVVPGKMLLNAVLRIGLLWTGAVTLVGLILFYRKELARVQV